MADAPAFAAIQTVIEALYESGAIGEKVIRQIVGSLREQRGTWGGVDDKHISDALDGLANAIENSLLSE